MCQFHAWLAYWPGPDDCEFTYQPLRLYVGWDEPSSTDGA